MAKQFMVYRNWAGAVFVKERDFFIKQGGNVDLWGKAWMPIEAEDFESAREKGKALLAEALESRLSMADQSEKKRVTLEFSGKATAEMTDAQLQKLIFHIESEGNVDLGDIEGVDREEAISGAVFDVENAY